jgi:hypothetical protein
MTRLIMLLVFGDLVRSTFLFLHSVVSIARGTVMTESAFCQAGGFFVQYGTETSGKSRCSYWRFRTNMAKDYAVLVIALHNALQIFHPSTSLHSNGLYAYRYLVYFGAVVIPSTMASLAFINPDWGYMSQGAFCSLPLRPFWYRLALAWIPRYIIAVVILGLAVAIYTHVGFEFPRVAEMAENSTQTYSNITTMLSGSDLTIDPATSADEQRLRAFRRGSSVVSMAPTSRHASVVASLGASSEDAHEVRRSDSVHTTRPPRRRFTFNPLRTSAPKPETKPSDPEAKPETQSPNYSALDSAASTLSRCPTAHPNNQRALQRSRIHRQVRLTFIYPIIYILMWLIPFVNHCMSYHDYWAAHPLYWLSLLSSICIASMGAVDCLVFSLRERPWRHIPSSDGSFLGSFNFWRTIPPIKANGALVGSHRRPSRAAQHIYPVASPETPHVQRDAGWKSNVARMGRSMRTSGSSDQAMGRAEMARTRLEMEKEERRSAWYWSAGERRKSTIRDTVEGREHDGREVRFADGRHEQGDYIDVEDHAGDGRQPDRDEVEAGMGAELESGMAGDGSRRRSLRTRSVST